MSGGVRPEMSSPRESPRAGPPPELLAVRSGSSSGWKTALFPLFQRKTHTELQKKNLGFRWRLYRLLERPNSSLGAKILFVVLLAAIILSVFMYYVETLPGMASQGTGDGAGATRAVEIILTVIFVAELLCRLTVGTLDPWNLLLIDVMFWVDVISILPFFAVAVIGEQNINESGDALRLFTQIVPIFRLLRIFKLCRHYSGWRVLVVAARDSGHAILVPAFAMCILICLLSGLLYTFEEWAGETQNVTSTRLDDGTAFYAYPNGFESLWSIFWLVTTLGPADDAHVPISSPGRLVEAAALLGGLLFTTMPITILGNNFSKAWERREVIEVASRVQEMLVERGHSIDDVQLVFREFDNDGSNALDWFEFREAMNVLDVRMKPSKLRRLFALLDNDGNGNITFEEFCRVLFPTLHERNTQRKQHAELGEQMGLTASSRRLVRQLTGTRTVKVGATNGPSKGRSEDGGEDHEDDDEKSGAAGGERRPPPLHQFLPRTHSVINGLSAGPRFSTLNRETTFASVPAAATASVHVAKLLSKARHRSERLVRGAASSTPVKPFGDKSAITSAIDNGGPPVRGGGGGGGGNNADLVRTISRLSSDVESMSRRTDERLARLEESLERVINAVTHAEVVHEYGR